MKNIDIRISHGKNEIPRYHTEKNNKRIGSPGKSIEDLIRIKLIRTRKSNRYSNLFFSISLCISLLFTITAFEWRFYDSGKIMDLGTLNSEFENIIDIPPTQQPPPPPHVIEQPMIIEVSNEEEIKEEIKINLDIEMTEEQKIEQRVFEEVKIEKEEEIVDEIFTIVENQPEPVGGFKVFYEYVGNNLKYPASARRSNIEGRVYVGFVVEKDGRLTDIKIIKGIGGGCDEETIRILSSAPNWNPGKQRGRPVRVKMVLPILFQLE